MLISRKLEEKLGMSCEAKGEREVEALALLAQDPGVPYAGFLDDMKYADSIGPNVRMILTRAETAAQLEEAEGITTGRLALWQRYHEMLEPVEDPDSCSEAGEDGDETE